MSRASEAYERLAREMDEIRPGCVGVDLFTADELTAAQRDSLKSICDACPLLALCTEYAALSKPPGGYWAGRTHRQYKAKEVL